MKKTLSMLLVLAMLFAFAACGADPATDGAENDAADWGITLTVENVTPNGLTLICTQKGGIAEGSLETGSEYWIEKNENGAWVKLQPLTQPVWDMMAHLIPKGETVEWTLDWNWLYGELGEGTYRICKTVVDFKESGASTSQFYCAEFEIKG